jgi:antiphage defense system Thoeris ThsA-like protein
MAQRALAGIALAPGSPNPQPLITTLSPRLTPLKMLRSGSCSGFRPLLNASINSCVLWFTHRKPTSYSVPPMKNTTFNLARSVLGGLGLLWLFLEPFYNLMPNAVRIGFLTFFITGCVLGVVWFFIDGHFVAGFLKRSIAISSNAIDSVITIVFDDLFTQEGCLAISVNEYFDSTVDGKHVAQNSLHGLMLTKFWAGHVADWDSQVALELTSISPEAVTMDRPAPGKQDKYPIGTTVSVVKNDHEFLCVVLTNTDTTSLKASASSANLHNALRGLLRKSRVVCSGRPLSIPLIGSGLAGTGIKPNIIVDLILLAIFEESKKEKVTGNIRIILPKDMRQRIEADSIPKRNTG